MDFEAFNSLYLEKLCRGDAETESHFVRYFTELVVLKLRSRGRSREEIDDIVQETFARALKLIRSPHGIRQPERLGPLVNSICNNILQERHRASGRTEQLGEETAHALTEPHADALAVMLSKETATAVAEVLARLPERDRLLLRTLLVEEGDKDEMCARMQVTRGHLRVLLHRAKLSFRALYTQSVSRGQEHGEDRL